MGVYQIMNIDTGGRECVCMSVIGSHNYGLNTSESKNCKIFITPTFEDLYNKNVIHSRTRIYMQDECEILDIRNLPELFWRAHINFIEVLHSDYFTINLKNEDVYSTRACNVIQELLSMKEELVTMNLPRMYNSFMNVIEDKTKSILRPSHGSNELIEKFGYDTKKFQLVMRCMDFIKRFADNNFTDFKKALYYNDNEPDNEIMRSYRDGLYTLSQAVDTITSYRDYIEDNYLIQYLSVRPDEEIKIFMKEKIKDIVNLSIRRY